VRLIRENSLGDNLPHEWVSWDIQVDIVGFIISPKQTDVAFVECKNSQITLVNLSQLLGYTKVVIPQYSIIVAPQGASDSLLSLLKTFNRLDILQYQDRSGKFLRYIAVARWDENSQCIDYGSIIPANYM
jgi:hypothetical protein